MTLKYLFIIVLIVSTCVPVLSQQLSRPDTLLLSRKEAESLFLENNLHLMAERLEIKKADADLIQARVWPNPELTLDQVNLWATPSQVEAFGDGLPPLVGSFGRNQQFGIELQQLILTAGKRKKLMAIEEVGKEMAVQYLEDLLRILKATFRSELTNLQFYQQYAQTFSNQLRSLDLLIEGYQNQVKLGNIAQSELVRLKAQRLEVGQDFYRLQKDMHESQRWLSVLMGVENFKTMVLDNEGFVPDSAIINRAYELNLEITGLSHRPDLHVAHLNKHYWENTYRLEKAQRIPDLHLGVGYDRGGSFMLDFVGFGVSLDLPVFDRNQGGIMKAGLEIEQKQLEIRQKNLEVRTEIETASENLSSALDFYQSIETGYEYELDSMLDNYTKNFSQRNISLMQYLDFLEAYLENKQTILEARSELNHAWEELQLSIGQEIE